MSVAGLVLVTWLSFLVGWAIGYDPVLHRLTESERRSIERASEEFAGLRSWYSVR